MDHDIRMFMISGDAMCDARFPWLRRHWTPLWARLAQSNLLQGEGQTLHTSANPMHIVNSYDVLHRKPFPILSSSSFVRYTV
jgi:hypothetical protein